MKALQQVKSIPPFEKTAKSGAPAKFKTQFPSDLLERSVSCDTADKAKKGEAPGNTLCGDSQFE